MQAKFSKDDSKLVVTLIDGAIYFLNNKTMSKGFFYNINENVPITSLKWKNNKTFLVGDTESKIYEVEYFKESSELCIGEEIYDPFQD